MHVVLGISLVVALLVIVPVVVLVVFDRPSARSLDKSREALWDAEVTHEVHRARLQHPTFDVVEAFFGRSLPRTLRSLYNNNSFINIPYSYSRPGDDCTWWNIDFLPLDLETFRQSYFEKAEFRLPIASLGDGDLAFVSLDESDGEDGPVYFYFHDGGECERVADSIAGFTAALRPRAK